MCRPSTIREPARPIVSGVMISYVLRSLSTPSTWTPDSWAKALAPTIALFGWTTKPVSCETSWLVRQISLVLISVWRPSLAGLAKKSARVRIAMTTSSSAALPARSPRPLIVHSTCRAPLRTPASELATAMPEVVVAVRADDALADAADLGS